MRPTTWYEGVAACEQQGEAYVLITVVSIAGSTPREAGSKMVVTSTSSIDTIGGGHLEFDAIKTARDMLAHGQTVSQEAKDTRSTMLRSYPLSSSLGQCCGGAVKVLFDVCNLHAQHLAIFGAGHVAQALIPIIAQLPLRIRWIDSRESVFPASMPANVTPIVEQEPETEVSQLPHNAWLVILTHDHQLDYRIVERALKYPSLPFVGLIGSDTKAKRFITKLHNRGFTDKDLLRLYTPIGNPDIPGKRPIEVAVSIAAQIIARLHNAESAGQSKHVPVTAAHDAIKE
ncbi:xanthine dehydrogenase accessory protein XdhC [Alteromonas sp. 345S023]|uniref:Xanthine dehydrogenase accessory protein XdhC n=1 Tax=Alteromonas profundi TaxID=2696062 RepID=A0A7X5RJL5_9ALTE|nr:xanthine dehydrogenase accessory protein XdhC [Alteromonas profundi]NDV89912.1 xanthine dehydrogenase accessory protein XdhC [Alteromonas profundi]